MNEYLLNINGTNMHIEYVYIPPQKEQYPDTEPLNSYIEIDRIYVYVKGSANMQIDLTDIMYEVADDWLINLESEIIEKLEG